MINLVIIFIFIIFYNIIKNIYFIKLYEITLKMAKKKVLKSNMSLLRKKFVAKVGKFKLVA